ncbi:hypothetical protein [Sphingopyxis macrogoltabida]|uniref:Uncharacterized protein n=1 Tax=Sphingopyxis macrogoltabida TaxID=33050 RepID=A0A0N9US69_SPHMC|nr:hypothetical protein [Sphingopyxis macrogoltabida]ALH82796.1 hypothetical protein AN936_21255 [Sphingopyxis macrogoltabida]
MSEWPAAADFYNRQRAADPAFDVIEDMYRSRRPWNDLSDRPASWFELVKIVRSVFGVSIDEAHRLILAHAGFRRLTQAAIDTDPGCARYVRRGIVRGRMAEIAELQGERPVIRLTWPSPAPRL